MYCLYEREFEPFDIISEDILRQRTEDMDVKKYFLHCLHEVCVYVLMCVRVCDIFHRQGLWNTLGRNWMIWNPGIYLNLIPLIL